MSDIATNTDDASARKQAEEALLTAETLQKAIFDSANFSSIATDAKGVIQIFNVGAERMLGYTAAEVVNKITPADISDPEEVVARAKSLSTELDRPITPGFEALVFKASRGIEDIYELTYIRKDGSRIPAVVSVTALRDAQDNIIGYLLIGTDNTARKLVEADQQKLDQRLRDQQFYTRSLIESNIDALMTTDPSGIITDVNKQMEALTGCTRDELIGAPFKNYFTDPDRAEAGIKLVLGEKKVNDYELTVCALDGEQTVVSYNASTFYDRGRTLQGVFAAARDVTERKRIEAESQRHWQLTQSIVDTIRDPLVVLESDMTVVTASKGFLAMFGTTQDEARGRRVSELGQRQWDVPALRHLMEKVLPEDKPFEGFEIEDDFPGLGRRVFNLNARKIFQPGNHTHRMLLVFEDITDRKQRERDAQMLTNEVSHRIKNNLQVVAGLIAYESRITATPCVQGYKAMEARIGAIARLYDLISQSSHGGNIAVGTYLQEIARALSASLLGNESRIDIEVRAEALEIDPNRAVPFGLLVNELATNAVKHAFPDGAGHVVLSVTRAGGEMELTVSDNGIGMKDQVSAKIPERRGSDYVTIFVRQLGGIIVPPILEESGTTVRVRLPMLVVTPEGVEQSGSMI